MKTPAISTVSLENSHVERNKCLRIWDLVEWIEERIKEEVVCASLFPSTYVFICLSFALFICSVYLYSSNLYHFIPQFIYSAIHLSVHLLIHLSIFIFIHLFFCLSIHPFLSPFIYFLICQSMHQFIYSLSYPSLSLSIYSFTYCSLYSSTYSSAYPFILFSLHPFIFLYFSLSICPFNHPSIYPLQVMWSQAFPRPVCRLSPQSTPTPMRQWHSQRS